MPQPASGSKFLLGFAPERYYQESPGTTQFFKAVLPGQVFMARTEVLGAAAAAGGVKPHGIAGPVGGEVFDVGIDLSAEDLPLFFDQMLGLGQLTAANPATGVYTFTGSPNGLVEPFYLRMLWGLQPVDRGYNLGCGLNAITFNIGDSGSIPARLAVVSSHSSLYSLAAAGGSNVGSGAAPLIRGVPVDPTLDIHVQVSQVVGGLQFKVFQGNGSAAFSGSALAVPFADSRAGWLNITDQAGWDVGHHGENYDPVQVLFPGNAAEHANHAVGDTWIFSARGRWSDPTPTYSAGQRMTPHHWAVEVRETGSDPWEPVRAQGGTVAIGWPMSPDRATGSKYLQGLDRDQLTAIQVTVPHKWRSRKLTDWGDTHKRFQMRLTWAGEQLADAAYRRQVRITATSCAIASNPRPVAGPTAVVEGTVIEPNAPDDGSPPFTVELTTSANYTPQA